ncbi:MAG: hypothetical protein ACOVOR_00435 [Rhabdochlamydiaceae bacterium]
MSSYDENTYLTFSQRERLFRQDGSSEEKKIEGEVNFVQDIYHKLYICLETYRHYLSGQQIMDPSLCEAEINDRYALVVVDEAQDFSPLQLNQLADLAAQKQIVYCLDSHQSLNDHFSKLSCLKRITASEPIDLPYTFRCSKKVADLANTILALKHQSTGGIIEKKGISTITLKKDVDEGYVHFIQELTEDQKKQLPYMAQAAIICHANDKKKLEEDFPGVTILTPSESKGLEYEFVILYDLFNHLIDKTLNTLAKHFNPYLAIKNRAKAGEAHHEYAPVFNQLYTAVTRARKGVYLLYNPQDHKFKDFVKVLLSSQDKEKIISSHFEDPRKSTPEEIKSRIDEQILAGNMETAWHLYKYHQKGDRHTFEEYYEKMRSSINIDKVFSDEQVSEKDLTSPEPLIDLGPQKIFRTSLSPKQISFLEELYKKLSLKNLENLFKYKSSKDQYEGETVACMLFHHRLNNKECLFVHLMEKGHVDLIKKVALKNPELFSKLISMGCAIAEENDDLVLKLAIGGLYKRRLISDLHKPSFVKVKHLGNQIKANISQLANQLWERKDLSQQSRTVDLLDSLEILDEHTIIAQYETKSKELGISLLHLILLNSFQRDLVPAHKKLLEDRVFIKEAIIKNIGAKITQEGPLKGFNLLFCLLVSDEGLLYFIKHFESLKNTIDDKNLLARFILGDNLYNQASPFYMLCSTKIGRSFLNKEADYFIEQVEKNPNIIYERALGEGSHKGSSSFYWLCRSSDGLQFIQKILPICKKVIKSGISILSDPISGEGDIKGTYPLYMMFGSEIGLNFIIQNWDFFGSEIKDNPDIILKRISDDGRYKGTSPLCSLFDNPIGITLLKKGWPIFEKILEENEHLLYEPIAMQGPNKSFLLFSHLITFREGLELLTAKWTFFKKIIHKKQDLLFHPLKIEGPWKELSLLDLLCSCEAGKDIVLKDWLFFQEFIEKNPAFCSKMENSCYKKTHFYNWLKKTETGKQLFYENLVFFKSFFPKKMVEDLEKNSGEL